MHVSVSAFQMHHSHRGLSSSVDMGDRKQKVKTATRVTQVWRPVSKPSTQVLPNEESVLEVTDKPKREVSVCSSSEISSAQAGNGIEVDPAVAEGIKLNTGSSSSHDNKDKVLGGETVHPIKKHSITVDAGTSLHSFIRGPGGSTQIMIEKETGVKIKISYPKREDFIIIEGDTNESVTRASEKIQVIIDKAVKSPNLPYSHFISLPLAKHPELVDKLVNFRNSILGITHTSQGKNLESGSKRDDSDNENKDCKLKKGSDVVVERKAKSVGECVKVKVTNIPLISYARNSSKSSTLFDLGIDTSIFIVPETFHLTVLMLKLWNKDRVHAATKLLQSISSEVMEALDNRPLSIKLKGLDCMGGSYAKADVLYVPVEEIGSEGRLMRACQVIIDAYIKAGFVMEKDANRKLKLHATVMNARHRERRNQSRDVTTFDACDIYKQYGSKEWGEYHIGEAHLSRRFVFDDEGYYHCCASLPFPEMHT